MKTEKYIIDGSEFRCFGFPNLFVSKKDVVQILQNIPGVEITNFSKRWRAEVFCEFTCGGHQFKVSEPSGDNS